MKLHKRFRGMAHCRCACWWRRRGGTDQATERPVCGASITKPGAQAVGDRARCGPGRAGRKGKQAGPKLSCRSLNVRAWSISSPAKLSTCDNSGIRRGKRLRRSAARGTGAPGGNMPSRSRSAWHCGIPCRSSAVGRTGGRNSWARADALKATIAKWQDARKNLERTTGQSPTLGRPRRRDVKNPIEA